jgi:hypothetical protein
MLGQFHCYICPTDYLTPEDLHQHNVQFHSNFADSTVNFTMPVNPQVAPFSNTRGGATSHETASCSTATAIPRRRAEVTFPDATFQITTKEGMGLPTAKPKRRAKTDAERQHTNVMRILKACDECRRTKQRVSSSILQAEEEIADWMVCSATLAIRSESRMSPRREQRRETMEMTEGEVTEMLEVLEVLQILELLLVPLRLVMEIQRER